MEILKQEILERVREPYLLEWTPESRQPWSHSSLKMLEKCPMRYFLEKVIKVVPPAAMDDEALARTSFGHAAHFMLEKRLTGTSRRGAYAQTEGIYRPCIPDPLWSTFDATCENIETFVHRVEGFKQKMTVTHLLVEQKLAFAFDRAPVEFDSPRAFFRGIIDLTIVVEDGRAILTDHKTAFPAMSSITLHTRQLHGCAALLLLGLLPDLRGVQPYIHYINDGVVKKGAYLRRKKIEETVIPELYRDIQDALERPRREKMFVPRRSGNSLCQYCPYNTICKSGFLKKEVMPLTGAFIDEHYTPHTPKPAGKRRRQSNPGQPADDCPA